MTQKAKATRARRKPERPVLRSLSDIYRFFRENTSPIYFVSPTAYNILGIDDWVSAFRYVCYFDSFDGAHDHVFVADPRRAPRVRDLRVGQLVPARAQGGHRPHQEERARQGAVRHVRRGDRAPRRPAGTGDRPAPARAARAHRLQDRDDAGSATRPASPSAPNVMARPTPTRSCAKLAERPAWAIDLVVQTAVRRLRRTTFFISRRGRLPEIRKSMLIGEELKVMKNDQPPPGHGRGVRDAARHARRARPGRPHRLRGAHPLPGRLVRQRRVRPSRSAEDSRGQIGRMARKLGDRLYEEGYRGCLLHGLPHRPR